MSKHLIAALVVIPALFLFPALSSAVPEGINLTWPGGGGGEVVFDGTKHAKKGLNCDACHIAGLFKTKKDADKMTMAQMNKGMFCGACHNGKKAFSTSDPKKCHECHKAEKKNHDEDKPKEEKHKKHN